MRSTEGRLLKPAKQQAEHEAAVEQALATAPSLSDAQREFRSRAVG